MSRTDLLYAQEQVFSREAIQEFFNYLACCGDDLEIAALTALYDIRDSFIDPEHFPDDLSAQAREDAGNGVLHCAVFVFAGLYSANKQKVPQGLFDIFTDFLPDCRDIAAIEARHQIFCVPGGITRKWISSLDDRAFKNNLCLHATGPLYALAEAFVLAQADEATLEANRRDAIAWEGSVSPSVLESLGEALEGDGEESEA